MKAFNIRFISLDLSNQCSKACEFCYNHSQASGAVAWKIEEVITFLNDCADNGLEAVSLGGGEPLEYAGIFEIIKALKERLFISITTNGLPLRDSIVFKQLVNSKTDKVHLSIHYPEDIEEVYRCIKYAKLLDYSAINSGINLLVAKSKIKECRRVFNDLLRQGFSSDRIILVPMKFKDIPSPEDLAYIAGNIPFQSTFCLTECQVSSRFCSVSWDKKVNFCSYSPSKSPLNDLSYKGLMKALKVITFKNCKP